LSVKKRIKELIKSHAITVKAFENSIHASNGYINSISKSIGLDKIEKIIEKYPNINLNWLLTGQGEMLVSTTNLSTDSITDVVGYLMENNDTLIADPLFREYVKSNLEILEIEREQDKLEKKKQVIKDQISQVSQTKVSQ
jgi:hypothetical protein